MNNYEEMRIESDVFATARENFDLLMQRLFKSMEKNNSDEGSITLKVDLQMSQDWVPDGKGGSIENNKPVIKHKVSIAVPVKDSMDGKKDAGMNLVWDEELKRYVLKYINEGGQLATEIMSMKIQRRVCRNEKRESTGQFFTVSKVRSTDHIR